MVHLLLLAVVLVLVLSIYANYRWMIRVASASPRKLLAEIKSDCLDPYPTSRTCALLAWACSSSGARIRQLCAERRGGCYYFVFHKPRGCVTQRNDESTKRMQSRNYGGRKMATVYDELPEAFPAVPTVGRLDRESCGLLLMTDDGLLSRRMHGENVFKAYDVVVDPVPTREQIELMRRPMEGVTRRARLHYSTRPAVVERRGGDCSSVLRVSIDQGKYHHVRNLCARSSLTVLELKRVQFGPLDLGKLSVGKARPLSIRELADCRRAASLADDDTKPLPPRGESVRHLTLFELWWWSLTTSRKNRRLKLLG